MRRFKAKVVYHGRGSGTTVIDVDESVTIKRGAKGIICEDEVREHILSAFDFSMSGGKGNTRIFWEGDKLYLQDLGSSNGTFIEYDEVEEPIKGWKKSKRSVSEKVPIKKTRDIRVARTRFTIEIEPVQTIIEHTGSGDVQLTEVAGDLQNIEIKDSVIQRSNIGTVTKGMDEDSFKEGLEWLDDRNQGRTDEVLKGQLELKGMTRDLHMKMEMRFNEVSKELPCPTKIEKKKLSVHLIYDCSSCGSNIGTVKDKKWKKWLMLGVTGAMLGLGGATFGVSRVSKMVMGDGGIKGAKRLFEEFTGKPLDEIPAEKFLLTNEEKDKMLMELRNAGIMQKINYCPACNNWVCPDCFDSDEMMCCQDSQSTAF